MNGTPIELLLSKLPNAKKNGKAWQARCPAHEDRCPSLSIDEGDNGRALIHCHAGCTVEAICAAVGLRVADLMPVDGADVDKTSPNQRNRTVVSTSPKATSAYKTAKEAVAALERQHGERAAMWAYTDAGGDPIGMIVRWDRPRGKDIRPVARHGGEWIIGGMSEPRPLYRLPDLADADRVFITEGEKAADAARSIGLTATTSPHGSKSADRADWTPLAGKQVVILPDNDAPGGKYANAVAAVLAKLTPPPVVKVVDLPGLPEHGDIVDWIDAHGDAAEPDDLRRQVEALTDEAEATKPVQPRPVILPWRPFPVDALPEPVRGFVAAGAAAIGCDESYIALPLITALASAIGATRRIQLKPGWCEPSVLWAAFVGDSGTLKSPAVSLALDVLRRLQEWKLDEYPELLRQFERDKLLYESDVSAWKKSGRNKGEPPPEKPTEPNAERYLVDDITIEALAERLQAAPRGLLVACDELASWIGGFDQYRGGRGADVPRWLSIHRADSLLVDRKSGAVKTIFVARAVVSVCGGIQLGTLRRALGDRHLENGLAARLLLALPPRRSKRWTEATVSPSLRQEVKRIFGRLLAIDFGEDENLTPVPIDLPLTTKGKAAWIAFYNEYAQKQEAATGNLAAAFSKLEGYTARLALVTHLVRWAADDSILADANAIDEVSVTAGVTLAGWFSREAERVYAVLVETDGERKNRQIIELIQRKGGVVTARDLMRSSRQYRTAADAENVLDGIARTGIGRWVDMPPTSKGGRPTRLLVLDDAADVDETPSEPREIGGCVNVNTVNAVGDAEAVNDLLADAAAEDDDEWGEI